MESSAFAEDGPSPPAFKMSKHSSDLPAALMGLFIGAIAVLIVTFTIVQLVNQKHAGAEAGHVAH